MTIKELWCSWFHGGGHIKRNPKGEIDWQCAKCGRWAGGVPLKAEEYLIDKDIKAKLEQQQ